MADGKIELKKEDFLFAFCRVCKYPDNPITACPYLIDNGEFCQKCIQIGKLTCKKTSLRNEVIFNET